MWNYIDNSGKCTSLPELAEEYLAEYCADTDQSVPWKLKSTQEKSYCNDSSTESSQNSPSGMMSAPSTGNRGEDQLTLFAEDFLAKTSVQQVKEQELPEHVQAYGRSMRESLTRYGLSMSLPKTHHCFAPGDLELFSKTLPTWGMMQDGECWELGTRVCIIREKGCGYLPTPTASMYKGIDWKRVASGKHRHNLKDYLPWIAGLKKIVGLNPNPDWLEWLMVWPIGWTELKPLAMGRFQKWLDSHGRL